MTQIRHAGAGLWVAFDAAMTLQAPWVNGLTEGVSAKDLNVVHRVIAALWEKPDGGAEPDEDGGT